MLLVPSIFRIYFFKLPISFSLLSFSYCSPIFPVRCLFCLQDEVALPALLVYRDGIQEQTLVRVTDDIGDNFADKDVVALLAKYVAFLDQ